MIKWFPAKEELKQNCYILSKYYLEFNRAQKCLICASGDFMYTAWLNDIFSATSWICFRYSIFFFLLAEMFRCVIAFSVCTRIVYAKNDYGKSKTASVWSKINNFPNYEITTNLSIQAHHQQMKLKGIIHLDQLIETSP